MKKKAETQRVECGNCKKMFTPGRAGAKFCTERCRMEYWKKEKREERNAKKPLKPEKETSAKRKKKLTGNMAEIERLAIAAMNAQKSYGRFVAGE